MRPIRLLSLLALAWVLPASAQEAPSPAAATAEAELEVASQSRVRGAEDAPVTIVELSDFQCPFCREFTRNTYAALDSAYLQTGKARLVFVHLPLPSHGQAFAAAEAAMCAGAQESFWPMHDRLFAGQEEWSGSGEAGTHFERYAGEIGLDLAAYRACAADDRMAPLILGDAMQAAAAGANATPTFILNGEKLLSGALPFEELQAAIEELLGNGQ